MSTPTNSGDSIVGVVRDLAAQLNQDPLPYTPPQIVKGVITAFASGATPPTVSLTLSGDTAVTDGVRFLESYSPTIGDTVAICKTGPDIFIMGAYANGASNWTQPTLSSGFTHNGASNGNVQFRCVWDNGSLKMQWKGAAARTANTLIVAAAQVPSILWPTAQRNASCTRGMGNGNALPNAQLVFKTDGTVNLDGHNYTITDTHTHGLGSSDVQLSGYLSLNSSDLGHAHGLGSSGSPSVGIGIPAADWVGFNSVEYFL